MRVDGRIERILASVFVTLLIQLAASSSLAADSLRRWGIVGSRDVSAQTLTIDGTVYRVSPRTLFKDLEGNVMAFELMEIYEGGDGIHSLDDATKVEYRAHTVANDWVLDSVKRIKQLPR